MIPSAAKCRGLYRGGAPAHFGRPRRRQAGGGDYVQGALYLRQAFHCPPGRAGREDHGGGPQQYAHSEKLWGLSIILNKASKRAGTGGPFWIIGL